MSDLVKRLRRRNSELRKLLMNHHAVYRRVAGYAALAEAKAEGAAEAEERCIDVYMLLLSELPPGRHPSPLTLLQAIRARGPAPSPAPKCTVRQRQATHVCCTSDAPKDEAREKALEEFVQEFAADPCVYGDGCPDFGTRHGTCIPCHARSVLFPP